MAKKAAKKTGKRKTKAQRLTKLVVEACSVGDTELAHTATDALLDALANAEPEPVVPEKPIRWNTDPEWMDYCASTLEIFVKKIAHKSTMDEGLREDCENEARIAIYQTFPQQVKDYWPYKNGQITDKQWNTRLLNYCKNTIRNAILSYLDSPKTGSWDLGRTTRIRTKDGRRIKVHTPARYSSLDLLNERGGLQVTETGEVTWDTVSLDGLPYHRGHDHHVPPNLDDWYSSFESEE
jgi:hypothetical protein